MKVRSWAASATVLASITACGGGESTEPPPTPVPTSIQLSATSVSLRIAESRQLTATVLDKQNRAMTGQTITWTSSDTGRITVDGAGLARGKRPGTATVTATSGSLTATSSGSVLAPQVQLASSVVKQIIGPEGGSIRTTDAGGRSYTLTLPAGWKPESTEVTIQALTAIENLPAGSTLLAGAHFTPEGLELEAPGTLKIEGVSAPSSGAMTGFGYTGTGADLYRASAGVIGGTISLVVTHFSGTGASGVQDASTYPTAPLSGASWTYMQTVINLAQQGQQTGSYDVPAIVAAINNWSTGIVEPALAAAGSDALLVTGLGRLRQWRYVVFCAITNGACSMGVPSLNLWSGAVYMSIATGVTASHQRSHGQAQTSLGAAINRAHEGCVVNQDLQAAKNGLYWLGQAEVFLPGERQSVESALANLCVKAVIEVASFPQNPAPNAPATLRIGGGLRFGTGPVSHKYPLNIEVSASGATPGSRFGNIPANAAVAEVDFSFTPVADEDVFFGIRLKEPWYGWEVHKDTTVHRALGVTVTISPTTAILNSGAQATFSATVTGATNTNVVWSATGGTVTQAGVYTAGTTAGTYQVKATSALLPSKSASATVTIIAGTIYSSDFSGTVGPQWNRTSTMTTPNGERYLGSFFNDTVRLSLNTLPPHDTVTVEVDLYIVGNMDGSNTQPGNGPDVITVVVGGVTKLVTTFSNFPNLATHRQAYPGTYPGALNAGATGALRINSLGYPSKGSNEHSDAVYRLTFEVAHTVGSFAFEVRGFGMSTTLAEEEWWGIDNIRVKVR